jgi:HEAT repeat protein
LEKVGASYLPITYMITALTLIVIFSIFLYLLRTITPYSVFFKVISFSAIFYFAFSIILMKNPTTLFFFAFKIFSDISLAALIACYWNFLDQYHDLQDAKRIYGIYNTAYFFGYMLSGIAINLFYNSTPKYFLFIIASISMIFALNTVKNIKKKINDIEDDVLEGFFSAGKRGFSSIMRIFYKSPFVIFLVASSLIIQLLKTTTEFSYMETLGKTLTPHLATNPNLIAEFLGKCQAIIASVNIVLGIFFYRKFVRKIGLGNMVLIPSLFFLSLYSSWLFYNSLIIVVIAIFAVDGILDTIDDNNFNLLVNAAPSKIRGTLRIINDSFFEPIGMLLSSIFLLFTSQYSIFFGFSLTTIFLVGAFIIKKLYPKSILKNLKENVIHFDRSFIDWMNCLSKNEKKEIEEDILEALESNSENTKLLAFKLLLSSKNKKRLPFLLSLADKFSENKKMEILKLLDKSIFSKEKETIILIKKCLKKHKDLRHFCNFYLAKRGLLNPKKVLFLLKSENTLLKSIAIMALKKYPIKETPLNREIAKKELNKLLNSKDEKKIVSAISILEEDNSLDSIKEVLKFLEHDSLKIRKSAAKALFKLSNKSLSKFTPKIINAMKKTSNNEFRTHSLKALGKIKDPVTIKELINSAIFFRPQERRILESIIINMGKKPIKPLLKILKDPKMHNRSRILASKILGRVSPSKLQENLKKIIETEIKRAYFYFFYSHSIQKKYPLYDLSLLEKALFTGFQSSVNFIIHLLCASQSIENSDLLIHSLHSKNEKRHADAIETLQQNLKNDIFKRIKPLIDDDPLEYKLEALNENFSKISLLELLSTLENSASFFDKTVAIHFKAKFKTKDWKESLLKQIKIGEKPLKHFAEELLKV